MDSLAVHIAVLTIANDASADRASTQAIVERARAAGHEIVDEATVKDNEGAIRDQLVRWIAEPEIDVVIVAASIESDAASAALAPLIMQTLPGFTDLFRWLTFQEIGASAMLSAAEAAQCESTFVFVLPAHEAAVRAAMDKLILPQLDVNTKPKNLVAQMPRLKDAAKQRARTEPSQPLTTPAAAHHAVPVPIAAEKTSGGSGLPPKLPARTRQPTANIIARKPPDPPTKPIDLAKLEKQIELSNANDAQTKQIQLGAQDGKTSSAAHEAKTKVVDMSAHQAKTRVVDASRLPRVPPGADDDAFAEEESLTFAEPPAAIAKRIPSITNKGAPVTPPFATPIARSTPSDRHTAPTPPSATPQLRPPADRHTAPTPPSATPQLRPPADRHTAPTPPSATPQLRSPTDRHTAPTPPSATPQLRPRPASAAKRPPTQPPPPPGKRAPTEPPPVAASRPPTEPPPAAANRPPTEPPPVPDDPRRVAPNAAELWSREIELSSKDLRVVRDDEVDRALGAEAPAPSSAVATTAGASAAPTSDAGAVAPTTPTSDAGEAARTSDSSASGDAAARDADARPSSAASRADGAPRAIQPARPPQPEVDPLAAITSRPLGGGELPKGDFVYPIRRSGTGVLVKVLAGLAVAALGFFAFVKLYPQEERPARTTAALSAGSGSGAASSSSPASADPAANAPAAEATGSATDGSDSARGSALEAEIEPEIEMADPEPRDTHAPATHRRATAKASGSRPTRHAADERGAGAAVKPANDGAGAQTEESEAAPAHAGAAEAATATDPSCDEVSCVLSKYDRPCCERYRPAETFTPKNVVPDQLDRAMVKAGVEKVKPRIVACGEKHPSKGTVKVAVRVEPSGAPASVSVTETPDAALGECVAAAMRATTFGKSVKGGEFTYPFLF